MFKVFYLRHTSNRIIHLSVPCLLFSVSSSKHQNKKLYLHRTIILAVIGMEYGINITGKA